ncbi:hypothetical protein ODS41_10470 [Pyrobaculum sp. 3827-6]|uniref:hypothetical protein n=1 Tax=Pyrobaculum sp. 3827-6 TaxID=2983604 RepID=UPI0021D89CF5|nr:hypothetical protein [Pyrobaculum sp. 3827-6]MCU7788333.1 hypothetical protein [Pyrobaculum sp. 3827-6]
MELEAVLTCQATQRINIAKGRRPSAPRCGVGKFPAAGLADERRCSDICSAGEMGGYMSIIDVSTPIAPLSIDTPHIPA